MNRPEPRLNSSEPNYSSLCCTLTWPRGLSMLENQCLLGCSAGWLGETSGFRGLGLLSLLSRGCLRTRLKQTRLKQRLVALPQL